jgi:hypothetical protein
MEQVDLLKGIISLEGVMGSGKSTAAVALAYEKSNGGERKIISNMHLNTQFLPYTHFSLEWFLENLINHELEDCVLVLDEMYQIFDSRSAGTKLNKLLTYFVVQTRKRGVDLMICTHHLDHVDKRGRRAVDIRGSCRYYEEKPCKRCICRRCKGTGRIDGYDCPDCVRDEHNSPVGATGSYLGKPCERCLGYGKVGLTVVNFLNRRLRKRYSLDISGNKYWHLFGTTERIPMQARMLQGIDLAEIS